MSKYVKTEKAARGQTVMVPFPRDDSSYDAGDMDGRAMGGSPTNLAHSLPGNSAEQEGTGHNKKNRFS